MKLLLFVIRCSTRNSQQIVSAHGFNSKELHVSWELFPSEWFLAPHSDHSNEKNIRPHGSTQVYSVGQMRLSSMCTAACA